VSSNDFDGPQFGPAGGRGAGEQGAQAVGAAGQGTGGTDQGTGGSAAQYPAPEGWGNDGVWRDSSIDSNYETGIQRPVPSADAPHEDPGFSYFSDGRGWQNTPGANGPTAPAPDAGAPSVTPAAATSVGATSVGAPAVGAPAVGATTVGAYGPGGNPTAVYGGGQNGYGAPMGPVPGGYGAGPGGPFPLPPGPGGPGGPFGQGPGGPFGPGPGGPVRPGGPGGPGRPRGPYGRRKGNWWRHWTWKKAAAVTGGVFVFFVLVMYSSYQYMSSSATIPAALQSANYQNTTVYYSDGKTPIGTIGTTDRQDLTYQQIPQQLQNAIVAAEDKNFWTEGGISTTGILRAAYHDVTNGGGDLNGGSTLTQEFVKNYYDGVGSQQTASRKIKEIFIAQKLAATKSKQWILTNYLNLVYMGEGAYGVEAASQAYFGVPVSQLTIAQDAVIGGIVQLPSTYPLPSYRSNLIARWHYVLQQMVDDKYITAAQAAEQKFPKLLTDQTGAVSGTSIMDADSAPWVPYIMDQVKSELTSPKADGGDGITPQELETGGLKIVTTISRPMEQEMYKAVSDNLNPQSISNTSGATVTSLPSWALVGAELEDPNTGQVIAEYPGKGQNMSPKACAAADCQDNTAAYTREQVGSSFKPYVLATAVSQGMNVKTSTLDTSPYACILPDGESQDYSVPISAGTYDLSGESNGCPATNDFKVENDGGEFIGKNVGKASTGAAAYGDNVQDALAQSSNVGFTDLAHRVGTKNYAEMAANFGVNVTSSGSQLDTSTYLGQVGTALGIAPLTVNEQTQMLATIADNGLYHQAHLVKYWQQGDGSEQMPQVNVHTVLNPSEDAQVQYAMEQTTIDGTAAQTVTYGQQTPGTVIGKTGTTSSSHAGFFIGSTTQYTLVVGMFTKSQASNYPNNLAMLGGGGFGGYWPAKIWNTFAEAEFSPTPTLFSTNPAFTGQTWNLMGPITKKAAKKPGCTETFDGQTVSIVEKGCPTPQSKNCTFDTKDNYVCGDGIGNGNNNGNGNNGNNGNGNNGNGNNGNGNNGNGNNGNNGTATPTSTDTTGGGGGGGNNGGTPTTGATQGGLAVGGGLLVLPGSLLWTTVSRRRRKKRAEAAE